MTGLNLVRKISKLPGNEQAGEVAGPALSAGSETALVPFWNRFDMP
jgi:hypothetical protein